MARHREYSPTGENLNLIFEVGEGKDKQGAGRVIYVSGGLPPGCGSDLAGRVERKKRKIKSKIRIRKRIRSKMKSKRRKQHPASGPTLKLAPLYRIN
jgi:hypothetical protein